MSKMKILRKMKMVLKIFVTDLKILKNGDAAE